MLNRLLVLAAIVLVLPVAAAASAHVDVVVDYNPALGELPEGLAVDKRGDVYLSLAPLGQIRKIARDGSETTVATLPPPGNTPGALGLAIDAPGNIYVAHSTFDPTTRGVYKIERDGSVVRLPGTGAITFPNGVTLDKRGNVYVTDTIGGAVWRIPASGGPAELWFASPLLLGDGRFAFGFPLGANGIAYRQNALVVSNTELQQLVRIEIEPDGSAGAASVLAEGSALSGADGVAFDVHGDVWVAVISQSTVVRVSPSGAVTTMLTAADGLDWASSAVFGKNGDLWVVNFAIGPPGGPGPALLRFSTDVKGQPVP